MANFPSDNTNWTEHNITTLGSILKSTRAIVEEEATRSCGGGGGRTAKLPTAL
jgi:hypothetical protein